MNEDIYYVYIHRRLTDNKVFYVGKGKNNRFESTRNRNSRWYRIVSKHGFLAEKVWEYLSEEEAFDLEVQTIAEMRYHFEDTLCNVLNGGKVKPCPHKMSRRSADANNKVAEKLRGRKRPKDVVEKIKRAIRDSDKTKSKMAWTAMCRILMGKRPVRLHFLEKIQNLPKGSLKNLSHNRPFPKWASDKSAAIRRGKKPHNYGASYPHLKGVNNSSGDKNVYEFVHKSGESFTGSRYDLCDKYGIKASVLGKLFYTKASKSVQGWSLK